MKRCSLGNMLGNQVDDGGRKMAIVWYPDTREFHLRNDFISYVIALLPDSSPALAYFGKPLALDGRYSRLVRFEARALSTHQKGLPPSFCLDFVPREYPTYGRGDFRFPAVELETEEGFPLVLDLHYKEHRVISGKPEPSELPATYCESEGEAETLVLLLEDRAEQIDVELFYTLFAAHPILARRTVIRNTGSRALRLTRAYSASLDLDSPNWDLIHFSGAWARERHLVRQPIAPGVQGVGSLRGSSSAQHNPSAILARPDCTETAGEAYGA
ncbi:glycoside hydrolase family 36 N-terminal domain-containing protein, partial [Gracilinema caldarium]|uniref:glycoside hydrolase family 36 N-terminal domain-containing protein n=1 Tax=Gracilinema caldarium TaxID=215591 RepID=UPI0026EF0FE3